MNKALATFINVTSFGISAPVVVVLSVVRSLQMMDAINHAMTNMTDETDDGKLSHLHVDIEL